MKQKTKDTLRIVLGGFLFYSIAVILITYGAYYRADVVPEVSYEQSA